MKEKKKYLLVGVFLILLSLVLTGCGRNNVDLSDRAITGFIFEDILVYPMAGLMWLLAKTVAFANYGVVIILATIIVRTLAWPIYAKTNDMTLKMQIVQPEAERIKKKYEGRDDPQSQQKMQMETMQLYKKYGIGLGGCFMPLVQLPIFLGFYRTILRIPATLAQETSWLKVFNSTTIFGIDLLKTRTEGGEVQKWGVIILAFLVGVTQLAQLLLSQHRQNKQRQEQQANTPVYRQTDNAQQKQTQTIMNIMMYFMTAMMVFFVYSSPAGLGLYWVVGNIYTTLQTYLGQKNSNKRLEKLKQKVNGGRY